MDHRDHVNLLQAGIPAPGGVWADLGSGTGAFTLALADLIGPTGTIYSADQDAGAASSRYSSQFHGQPAARRKHLRTAAFGLCN